MVIILFMYIFMFRIFPTIPLLNSGIFVGILLFGLFIISPNYRLRVLSIIKKKKTLRIFACLSFVIFYTIFITSIMLNYDFTLAKQFVLQFINLLIGVFVYSLYVMNKCEDRIIKDIIYVFIIQSAIQFISFISPEISNILNVFRSENAILIGQQGYGGLRGLALSGPAFFSLAIGYGLVLLIYIINWSKLFLNYKLFRIIFFVLLVFGATSAARISYVGIVLGLAYKLYEIIFIRKHKMSIKIDKNYNLINIFFSGIIIIFIVLGTYLVFNTDPFMDKIENMSQFAFQFYYNWLNTGEITTSSTEVLFNKMYFKVDSKTFLFGDGIFLNPDGSYYKGTDAGYMRNILYFGVLGVIVLIIYQLKFFLWRDKKDYIKNILILAYVLIVHIKGDVLGYGIITQNILLLAYFNKLNLPQKEYLSV